MNYTCMKLLHVVRAQCTRPPLAPNHLKGDSESGDAHTWRGRRHIQLRGADVGSQWVKPGEGSSCQEQPTTDTIHLINEQVSQNGNPTSDRVFLYISNLHDSSTHTKTI